MTDQIKSLSEMQSLLADNSGGNISAQDIRDALLGLYRALSGRVTGMVLSNNGTDADHDLDISAGVAWAANSPVAIYQPTAWTKQCDTAWAAGDGNGALATGTLQADTWYHVYAIRDPGAAAADADAVDYMCDTVANGVANLPAGYTEYKRIGSFLTDGSANITAFDAVDLGQSVLVDWGTNIVDLNTSSPSTGLTTVSVPACDGILWRGMWAHRRTSGDGYAGVGRSATNAVISQTNSTLDDRYNAMVHAQSGQIYLHYTTTSGSLNFLKIFTTGYIDGRMA